MKIFKNILVYQAADHPVSASLRIAARFSRQMGSRVVVVDVREQDHDWWRGFLEDDSQPRRVEKCEIQEALDALIYDLDFPDDNIQVKALEGRPIDVLVTESVAGSHDLILKDADSDAESLFFGSLDLRLLRLATAPVWIADPSAPAKARRILAAIDPHVRGDEMEMNERIIRLASLLARQDSAELHIVSAWYTPSAGFEQRGDEFSRYKKAKSQTRRHAWENIEHIIDMSLLRVPPERVWFENGLPGDTIVSAVQDLQPDVLVMGSVARRGIPGLWVGNTAEEVSRQIRCSLLTLKPEDFTFLLPAQLRARR